MNEHKHNENCYSLYGGFREYLIHVAPSYLWGSVQDIGSYQGSVYGVAYVDGQIALYEDSYGSCSGCGAWGEGGEPSSEEEIRGRSKFFTDPLEALAYVAKNWLDTYEGADLDKVKESLDEISYRFLDWDWNKRKLIKNFKATQNTEA